IARVVAVLAAAVVCTHALGLGERAVFTTIAMGNLASAAGLVALFFLTERRMRVTKPGAPPVSELAATGTERATLGGRLTLDHDILQNGGKLEDRWRPST